MLAKLNTWLLAADEALTAKLARPGVLTWRHTLLVVLTHSGDVLPFLTALGLFYLVGGPAWRARVLALVVADLAAFIVSQAIKWLVRRQRPVGSWGRLTRRIDPYSFPSGHAARGGTVAAMGLLVGPFWFGCGLAIWGLLVAYSRVALGVHYLLDAASGFLLGAVIAVVLFLVVLA